MPGIEPIPVALAGGQGKELSSSATPLSLWRAGPHWYGPALLGWNGYRALLANGSVSPLIAIGLAITQNGSKVLPLLVRPS